MAPSNSQQWKRLFVGTVTPIFLDSVGGGAWPFLVGGVICLVNSDNERDSVLLNSVIFFFEMTILLRGTGNS